MSEREMPKLGPAIGRGPVSMDDPAARARAKERYRRSVETAALLDEILMGEVPAPVTRCAIVKAIVDGLEKRRLTTKRVK